MGKDKNVKKGKFKRGRGGAGGSASTNVIMRTGLRPINPLKDKPGTTTVYVPSGITYKELSSTEKNKADELISQFKLTPSVSAILAKKISDAERSDDPEDVDKTLDHANMVLKGNGVENIRSEHAWVSHYYQDTIALYVNQGDTYDTTLLYDTEKEKFIITDWGSWYEGTEAYKKELAMDV